MFKVNNMFTPCSNVSIVNFEHVIDDWENLNNHQNKEQPYTKTITVEQIVSSTYFTLTLFSSTLFQAVLNDWFKLDDSIRNSESTLKSRLLLFIRQVKSNVYKIFDPL